MTVAMKKLMQIYATAISFAIVALPLACVADDFVFLSKIALSAEELDGLRGGFFDVAGFKISLGIERSVLINNELVTSTMLQIPDLGALTGRGAGAATLTGPQVSVVQNGPGNSVDPAVLQNVGPGGLLSIVQNSLNNQLIRGQTTINAMISGAGSLGLRDTISSVNLQVRGSAR